MFFSELVEQICRFISIIELEYDNLFFLETA